MLFQRLLNKLENELYEISKNNYDIIEVANLSIVKCRNTLSEMNRIVLKNGFSSKKEEICFFKETKVTPLSKLIYFAELRSFELHFPKPDINEQRKYIRLKIKKINKFFNKNVEFLLYCYRGESYFDKVYFTRNKNYLLNVRNLNAYYRPLDFSTSHDILLGKLEGFKLLLKYLEKRIFNLDKARNIDENIQLKWLLSKTALIELMYGLNSCNAIDADISEIKSVFEVVFNLKIDNPYRTYSEIKIRKTNRTLFLDKMRFALEDRMEKADE